MKQEISSTNIMTLLNQSMSLALAEEDPNESIKKVLQFWGEEFSSDRVYIFELIDNEYYDNTYEWCNQGIRPEIDGLQGIPKEVGDVWVEEFKKTGVVIVKDVEDIKETAPLVYDVLKPQELTSVITCPIYSKGEYLGFYGVDNPPASRLDNVSETLSIIGNFLDSLIVRRNLKNELLRLSENDALTGAYNKHAMDKRVLKMDKEQSCSIIYCDICGLKRVNDLQGHAAGDQLIKNTADNLNIIFGKDNVFRVGGDEFVVLENNISEMESKKKIKELRNLAKENPIAIGYVWSHQSDEIEDLIQIADANMYEDKKQYYARKNVENR